MDNDANGVADEGCDGFCGDQDGAPVNYSSGSTHSTRRTDLELPSVEGLPFGFRRVYQQQRLAAPGYRRGKQLLDSITEQPTFVGMGWQHSYQDTVTTALCAGAFCGMSEFVKPSVIGWKTLGRGLKFVPDAYVGGGTPYWRYVTNVGETAQDEELELRFYGDVGSGPDVEIVRLDNGVSWEFDFIQTAFDPAVVKQIAFLSRTRRDDARIDVNRDTMARISSVQLFTAGTVLEKTLSFDYDDGTPPSTDIRVLSRIVAIRLDSDPTPVVTFSYQCDGLTWCVVCGSSPNPVMSTCGTRLFSLERATYADQSYERYLGDVLYDGLTDIIQRGSFDDGVAPPNLSPPMPSEFHVEGNARHPSGFLAGTSRSSGGGGGGGGESLGYTFNAGGGEQYDLDYPEADGMGGYVNCDSDSDCSTGSGYGCWIDPWTSFGYCMYRRNFSKGGLLGHTTTTPAGVSRTFADGRIESVTSPAGTITTYSFDTEGRLACLVKNDDNTTPGPASCASAAACGGPVAGVATCRAYSANATTTYRASTLSPGAERTTVETTDNDGNIVEYRRSGYTHLVTASGALNPVWQDRVTTSEYYSHGRIKRVDGPLDPSVAYDVVDFTYYPSSGSPNSMRLATKTKWVGVGCGAGNCTALVTSYSNYDEFGNARTIQRPDGVTIALTTNAVGRVTAVQGGEAGTLTITYNPNGTIHNVVDGDGICLTYEFYQRGALRAKRRSSSGSSYCGQVPIVDGNNVPNGGETEVYVYALNAIGDPVLSRLQYIRRYQGSIMQYQQEYAHTPQRELMREYSAIVSSRYRDFSYDTDGRRIVDELANCYPGSTTCSKTTYGVDELGRREHEHRYRTDTDVVATTFGFDGANHFLPNSITTGDGVQVSSTHGYVYNDFGELVRYTSPNSGVAQLQYDKGGNVVVRRDATGAFEERTTTFTYDSLGRKTSVDHDSDTLVDCSDPNQAGAVLTDEEYFYDSCPAEVPAGTACNANSAGKLTMARVALYCSGLTAYRRGTWYEYDSTGRLSKEIVADDATMSAPLSSAYIYTAGGRPEQIVSPLHLWLGNRWFYDTESGEQKAAGWLLAPMVDNVLRMPFGPANYYDTNAYAGGSRIHHETLYRYDYSKGFQLTDSPGTAGVDGVSFYSALDDVGRVTARYSYWNTSNIISRYYGYDRLGRLTCETDRSVTTCPTTAANGLRANYGHHNGTTLVPPDNRQQIHYANADQQTTGTVSYYHDGGSDRLAWIYRAGWTALGNDGAGRRVSDDDYAFAGGNDEKRTFTYLPNGRLGTVQGKVPAQFCTIFGTPFCSHTMTDYTLAFAYDHRGRVFNATYWQSGWSFKRQYHFYYDANDRMIAAKLIPNDTNLSTYQNWHYYFLDGERVAAYRQSVNNGSHTFTPVWFINDALGTPYQVIDQNNTTLYLGDVEGFGWRNVKVQAYDSTIGRGLWMPFALPGQVVFDETTVKGFDPSCYSSSSSCPILFARPPIAQNGRRDYDPYTGRFLEEDPVNEMKFIHRPHSYLYPLDPISMTDVTGLQEVGDWEFIGCRDDQVLSLINEIGAAYSLVKNCDHLGCNGVGEVILDKLLTAKVVCVQGGVFGFVDPEQPDEVGAVCGSSVKVDEDRAVDVVVLNTFSFERDCGPMACTLLHEASHLGFPASSEAAVRKTENECCLKPLGARTWKN